MKNLIFCFLMIVSFCLDAYVDKGHEPQSYARLLRQVNLREVEHLAPFLYE